MIVIAASRLPPRLPPRIRRRVFRHRRPRVIGDLRGRPQRVRVDEEGVAAPEVHTQAPLPLGVAVEESGGRASDADVDESVRRQVRAWQSHFEVVAAECPTASFGPALRRLSRISDFIQGEDGERALILQPDVLFVSTERLSIIRDQVWGAPDLVAEVLSHGTQDRDRGEKLGWYRQYGVRECWLVNLPDLTLTVIRFADHRIATRDVFRKDARIVSAGLPEITSTLEEILESEEQ